MSVLLAFAAPVLAASFADAVPGTISVDLFGNVVTTGTFPRGAPATVHLVADRLLGLPPTGRYMPVPLDDAGYALANAAILNPPGLGGGTELDAYGPYRKVLVVSDAPGVAWGAGAGEALKWKACTRSAALTAAWVAEYPDQLGREIWECAPDAGGFHLGAGDPTAPTALGAGGVAAPTTFTVAAADAPETRVTLQTLVDGSVQEQATVVFEGRRLAADVIVRPRGAELAFQLGWGSPADRESHTTRNIPLSTPIDLAPVGFTYGFLVHDLGRSISGTIQVYPIFAPRKLEYWPLAYGFNFLTVSAGIRFGSNEDLLGLTLGPALNLAPGFQLLGGLQFGTANITDPWRIEREWFVGVGFSPDVFTKVRTFQKDRAAEASGASGGGGS